jgi:hypothetical protein
MNPCRISSRSSGESTPLPGELIRAHLIEPAKANLLGHSSAFITPNREAEVWRRQAGGPPVREVFDARIFEISAVASPAYQGTSLGYRDNTDWKLRPPKPGPRVVRRSEREFWARKRTLTRFRAERNEYR